METYVIINIAFIAILIILGVIGIVLGLGRSLKMATGGIFGIILSIVFSVLVGGALLATPAIGELVDNGNYFFYHETWRFLGIIHLATIIYFILIGIIFQVSRIIIISIIRGIEKTENKVVMIISKALGATFLSGAAFTILLLVFAAMWLIRDTNFVISIAQWFEDSFLYTLFINNPIRFGSGYYNGVYS